MAKKYCAVVSVSPLPPPQLPQNRTHKSLVRLQFYPDLSHCTTYPLSHGACRNVRSQQRCKCNGLQKLAFCVIFILPAAQLNFLSYGPYVVHFTVSESRMALLSQNGCERNRKMRNATSEKTADEKRKKVFAVIIVGDGTSAAVAAACNTPFASDE